MEISGKHILIVGLGVSGLAAAKFLSRRGGVLTATDTAPEAKLGPGVGQIRQLGARIELGPHRAELFEEAEIIVLSPGVSHTIPAVERARQSGIPVLGEIELASRFIREPIIAVTGTNGKTTTTSLIGEMLGRSGIPVFVGGNIGNPLIGYPDGPEQARWIVAEVSSFQLDTIETFRPRIGVLLNITEDHLDRYPSFEAYARAKGRLFLNQQPGDTAVLNGADPTVRRVCRNIRSQRWVFTPGSNRQTGAAVGKNTIRFQIDRPIPPLEWEASASLPGAHNLQNIAAAALAALAAGGSTEGIRAALSSFRGLAHRLAYVATRNGVRYYDDSKATNVDAVVKALETFADPVVLIMGGRDKGGDFRTLKEPVARIVKHLVLMGEAGGKIHAVLGRIVPSETVATLAQAVVRAHRAASPGDVVLLAPGCTSFDQFDSYKERGDMFCKAVETLG